MPRTPKQLDISDPEICDAVRAALLMIQSYRWRLAQAGYPFREPPGVDRTVSRLRDLLGENERNSGPRVTRSAGATP